LPLLIRQGIEHFQDDSGQIPTFDFFAHLDRSSKCDLCLFKSENRILRSEAAYWKSIHKKAKAREAKLIEANKELSAKLNTDFHSRYKRQNNTLIKRSRLSPRFYRKAMEL
jgi:hypothetical protein